MKLRILLLFILLRTRWLNMNRHTTVRPQMQAMVIVSVAPPSLRRETTALTPAPSTMPAFNAGGTSVFSFFDRPVNPNITNNKPNSS